MADGGAAALALKSVQKAHTTPLTIAQAMTILRTWQVEQ
jgi:hypothetical protein